MEMAAVVRKQHCEEFLVCLGFSYSKRLVLTAVRKSKWVPLPLCRPFLVGEPFMAQLGLLKVSQRLGNLYCSRQRFFFLVAVYGTKLKVESWK